MRKIDLQRTLLGGGSAPEDFQDQARSIDDLSVPMLFEIALLHRCQRMVDNDQAGIGFIQKMTDFLDLAGAEQCRRTWLVDRDDKPLGHLEIDGERQPLRFLKLRLDRAASSGR